jgi:heme-degrading monooxygenase HmoA
MVLEIAMLTVIPGREAEFENSFSQAKKVIASADGFVLLDLHRALETPNRYALHVRWQTVEDHTDGFRKSPRYQEWKRLLHRFYDPFPVAEHYERVGSVESVAE